MRIGFLLGSGVSIPAGMPSTQQLTDSVLDFEKWERYPGDWDFHRRCDARWSVDGQFDELRLPNGLQWLIEALRQECADYLELEDKLRIVNYEDLYYAASQVHEHLACEYENPAIEPLARALLGREQSPGSRHSLAELAQSACEYIHDVVSIELSCGRFPAGHLACVVEAVRDQSTGPCDIFTLNHDTLIERVLASESIPYIDGFEKPTGDVAMWKPKPFTRTRHQPLLLKLHGSIDWWLYKNRLAKALNADVQHAHRGDGKRLPIPIGPRILIGTFNKIRDYSGRPFFDLLTAFRKRLEVLDWLVVSGYSFGDKGINADISWALRGRRKPRLLVLDEEGEGCLDRARGAIRNLRKRVAKHRFLFHSAYLCDCSWSELKQKYRIDDPATPSR